MNKLSNSENNLTSKKIREIPKHLFAVKWQEFESRFWILNVETNFYSVACDPCYGYIVVGDSVTFKTPKIVIENLSLAVKLFKRAFTS